MCHRKGILESIIQFRQMMADSKFFEVQKLIEVQLSLKNEARYELLKIYFESLKAQQKIIPVDITLELSELESENNHHEIVLELLNEISSEQKIKFYFRILKLKLKAAAFQGQMDVLYQLISDFYLRQFEKQVPTIPQVVTEYVSRFFPHDFNLKLKELALALMLNDIAASEKMTKDLILSTVEKSSPKGIKAKLETIGEILKAGHNKAYLEIYQNYCFIAANGLSEKSDYKKIVEMIIFFDDFKFQALILNLLSQLNLVDEAKEFAASVRSNKEYNFVHFDKFFPHLKSFFVQPQVKKSLKPEEQIPTPDLKLTTKVNSQIMPSHFEMEDSEDDQRFMHLLKYQSYTPDQLCDLAVSFLQSEMPKVALRASELAMSQSVDDRTFLKGSYLKLTCQLQLQDLRAALDTCLVAMTRATSRDDILSFLYGQAEIYIRLNQKKQAKNILSKILTIDSKYRLAKERLDKLNEI
jgi:tetratricopeptide (TPR) repeat protein